MWHLIQFIIDVLFAAGILGLTAAHFSGRDLGTEFDVFREVAERDIERLESKLDGGTKP